MNRDIKYNSSVKSATEESEEFRVSGIMISTVSLLNFTGYLLKTLL